MELFERLFSPQIWGLLSCLDSIMQEVSDFLSQGPELIGCPPAHQLPAFTWITLVQ